MAVLLFYENGWFYKFENCICAFLIHKFICLHLLIVKLQVSSWFWCERKWNLHIFLTLFSVSNNFHSVFKKMSGSENDITNNLESCWLNMKGGIGSYRVSILLRHWGEWIAKRDYTYNPVSFIQSLRAILTLYNSKWSIFWNTLDQLDAS